MLEGARRETIYEYYGLTELSGVCGGKSEDVDGTLLGVWVFAMSFLLCWWISEKVLFPVLFWSSEEKDDSLWQMRDGGFMGISISVFFFASFGIRMIRKTSSKKR
ncbi:hypothetical protein HOY80DRAFT_182932 [Tuber brumale]|nr:hypothetical protein HOY80DRAFT_182932 [Tuber brumale]